MNQEKSESDDLGYWMDVGFGAAAVWFIVMLWKAYRERAMHETGGRSASGID